MSARRRLRATLAASAVVALAAFARADAPADQYNLFNLNSDVIQDLNTRLYWERYPAPTPTGYTFAEAALHCGQLSLGSLTMGWRVPSYKELLTIEDESPHMDYEAGALVLKWVDGNAFPDAPVTAHAYWSSSSYPGPPPGAAYAVDFHTGFPQDLDMGNPGYVRCVRDAP